MAAWVVCSICDAAVRQDEQTSDEATEHHRLRGWNRAQRDKTALYKHICAGLGRRRGTAGGTLLDVGTCTGRFLDVAETAGYLCIGTELVEENVQEARRHGHVVYRSASLLSLPPAAGPFDVIAMLDVNYYFDDQRVELETALSRLQPGGWLVMRTTNKRWLVQLAELFVSARRAWGTQLFKRASNDHRFVQGPDALSDTLEAAGFCVSAIEPDISRFSSPATSWLVRMVYASTAVLSSVLQRPVLVPGIVVWAQRR